MKGGTIGDCCAHDKDKYRTGDKAKDRYRNLNNVIDNNYDTNKNIIGELYSARGIKSGHWIWWIFPTGKQGAGDTHLDKRILNSDEFIQWIDGMSANTWERYLHILFSIMKLPSIDKGRFIFFKKIWYNVNNIPNPSYRIRLVSTQMQRLISMGDTLFY